jgi:hypothetical protein
MTITIYSAEQVELTEPAYFRKKGHNITNWYLAVQTDGKALYTSEAGNHEGLAEIWLDNTYEPCSDAEFFEALAANTSAIVSKQKALAKKWGLVTFKLEGGAYAD